MKRTLGIIGASAVIGLGVLGVSGPAFAATDYYPTADWRLVDTPANLNSGSKIVNSTTVELVGKGTDAPPHYGTSIETHNLGKAGSTVTVDYALSGGASFAAGAIRLFVYDKTNANTMTEAPTKSIAAEAANGKLTLTTGFTGNIGTVGLVYDSSNGKAEGKVTFSNLMVGDTKVLFKAPAVVTPPKPQPRKCEAYLYFGSQKNLCDRFATAPKVKCSEVKYKVKLVNANNDPWGLDGGGANVGDKGVGCESYPVRNFATPSPSHTTTKPTPTTSKSPVAAGGPSLPVTGPKVGTIAAIGGVILAGGVAVLILGRRRRNKVEFQA